MSKTDNPNSGHRQRLKDKFVNSGARGLHDYELIELLLTFAIPRRDVKPIAKSLIKRFKSYKGVMDATIDELKTVDGMGDNSAALLNLIKASATYYLEENIINKNYVKSPEEVINYLKVALSGEKIEKFLALFLSAKNEILGLEVLHEGTIDQTKIYPRKALEEAFKHNARSIIFVHNHPSGDPTPSESDKMITRNLEIAAQSVDIKVHDHIIIGRDSHFSGRENGWIRG